MSFTLEEKMGIVLSALSKAERDTSGFAMVDGDWLQKKTDLTPDDINDSVSILVDYGYATWMQYSGTAPFDFGEVEITPIGRLEIEKTINKSQNLKGEPQSVSAPLTPIGSPYGFQDEDWEFVAGRKSQNDRLFVVLGYQFKTDKYDSKKLSKNIENDFKIAVETYNS